MENLCKIYELLVEVHQSYRRSAQLMSSLFVDFIICGICDMDVSETGNVSKNS